jgi:hypothetical protein
MQYVQLRERLQSVIISQEMDDRFVWRWSSSGVYSASSAYAAMFTGQTQMLGAKELWKAKAPNKCRFFVWLVLHGRSWTSERAWRHGLRNDACCALCDQSIETLDHLPLRQGGMVQSFAPLWMAGPHTDNDGLLHGVVASLAEENSEREAESVRFLRNPRRLVPLAGAQCEGVRGTGFFLDGSAGLALVAAVFGYSQLE